jgi:hypothetical protein
MVKSVRSSGVSPHEGLPNGGRRSGRSATGQEALYLQRARLLNQRQVDDTLEAQGASPSAALGRLGNAVWVHPGTPTAEGPARVGGDGLSHGYDVRQGRISIGFLSTPTTDTGADHLSRLLPRQHPPAQPGPSRI